MRINKYIAKCGLGSRRSVEEIIKSGDISLNGIICTEFSAQITDDDEVMYKGRVLEIEKKKIVAFHKPPNCICAKTDPLKRKTVYDYLPKSFHHLNNIGRLDYKSEGLLLFTNDGNFAKRITDPLCKIEKEYYVKLNRKFSRKLIPEYIRGVNIEVKKK